MNEVFFSLGIESWKPWISGLLLSPIPLLLMVLVGARLMWRRRLLAWALVLLGCGALWLSSTEAVGNGLKQWLIKPPPALTREQISALKRAPHTAIVVLGGGRRTLAPEYGMSTLHPRTAERLRYGLWLARETGLPVAFSGGVGHGATPGPTEAEVAGRVAEQEYGRPLRWLESQSRDTHENANKTVELLLPQGIEQIVLVTHDYHMRRAMANFERAAQGSGLRIVPAPMGLPRPGRLRGTDFLPSQDGFEDTWLSLHEWVGRLMGA